MPTDSAGNYSLPPIYLATPGTTILAEQHNSPLQDIASAMSNRLTRDGRNGMVGDLDMGTFKIKNLKAGEAQTDGANVSQLVPVGAVIDWALNSAPDGWLLCDGQVLTSGTSYPVLRTALINDGFPYGDDGNGNPKVPDARGRVAAGKDDMGGTSAGRLTSPVDGDTLGATGGAQTHTLTQGEMPSHHHNGTTANSGQHNHGLDVLDNTNATGSQRRVTGGGSNVNTALDGLHSHSFTTNDTGGDSPHNNVQPTIIFNKIIRASF